MDFFSDGCHAESEHDIDLSYFQSLGYLQTVAFTIGYGHISPTCHLGQVFYCLKIQLFFVVFVTSLGAITNDVILMHGYLTLIFKICITLGIFSRYLHCYLVT